MGQDGDADGAPALSRAGEQRSVAFIPVASPDLGGNERRYVDECIETGWISSAGGFVRRFEEAFAAMCGVEHAVAVSSGTAALHLALVALGIGPGDEVLVPVWTFAATANTVRYVGARPVLVDVDAATWGMDPAAAAGRITRRTKAIIAVHLYGRPADVVALGALARRRRLALIEDAAEAHGAAIGDRRVGSFGAVGCFSTFANKIVTTGEGGVLVTGSRRLAETTRMLRDHGMSRRKYWHPTIGFSYGLGNLQAAVGVAQLERFDALLRRKDAIAERYTKTLAEVPGVSLMPVRAGTRPVCWLYSILVEPRAFGMTRDALMRRLEAAAIETRPFFHPLHLMPPYRERTRFPVAERLAARGLNLPSGPMIADAAVDRVASTIRALQRSGRG
ncbi:MAG TPA: DegT/DnrJ/EryC1/StrS family aminotransferase [Methylomirabilota bacterium]|nr:DegT/DnrJ/EryC1/StrS family aminotransferase [Methylomirabilota bacterium]